MTKKNITYQTGTSSLPASLCSGCSLSYPKMMTTPKSEAKKLSERCP